MRDQQETLRGSAAAAAAEQIAISKLLIRVSELASNEMANGNATGDQGRDKLLRRSLIISLPAAPLFSFTPHSSTEPCTMRRTTTFFHFHVATVAQLATWMMMRSNRII